MDKVNGQFKLDYEQLCSWNTFCNIDDRFSAHPCGDREKRWNALKCLNGIRTVKSWLVVYMPENSIGFETLVAKSVPKRILALVRVNCDERSLMSNYSPVSPRTATSAPIAPAGCSPVTSRKIPIPLVAFQPALWMSGPGRKPPILIEIWSPLLYLTWTRARYWRLKRRWHY